VFNKIQEELRKTAESLFKDLEIPPHEERFGAIIRESETMQRSVWAIEFAQ
jgi:hypothetical protein